jgi:hypothetical protein
MGPVVTHKVPNGAHKKGFKTEVLKPLMSALSMKPSQKICDGIAAVNGVCRAQ